MANGSYDNNRAQTEEPGIHTCIRFAKTMRTVTTIRRRLLTMFEGATSKMRCPERGMLSSTLGEVVV